MVFAQRDIESVPNIQVNNSKPFLYAPPLSMKREQVLLDGNENNMIGVITQLAMLANYANDVFTNLMSMATTTSERILTLGDKVNNLVELAPSIERTFTSTPIETLFTNPRQETALPIIAEAQFFTADSQPKSIKDMYNNALPPPPLHMMDEGRKCLSLYTNPQFFLDEWIAEQIKIRQAAKEERRKRREERRLQREKEEKGQEKKTKNQLN